MINNASHDAELRLRHVLLIYRTMIPSIRLCGHCQMEYLQQHGQVEYRAVQEMKINNEDLNWSDIVLLGRLDSWYEKKLVEKLHHAGKYLIYIIDDDLLNIPPEISSASHFRQKSVQENIRRMMQLSNAIMSPSPLLLEKYAIDGREAIQIEEPAIDPVAYKPHDPNKPIKIGFAGSIDRTGDIETILKEALIRVKNEYGDKVQFEFFGAVPSFAKEIDANCIPYCDSYDEYRAMLNSLEWDIGLAPMPDTPFHACKHYNKFIEYAAAGILGVYSNVMPYTRLRDDGTIRLFLCENLSATWQRTLEEIIKNRNQIETMRKVVQAYICKSLCVENVSIILWRRINELIQDAPKTDTVCLSKPWVVVAIIDFIQRAVLFLKKNGIKSSIIALKKLFFRKEKL